MNLFFSIRLAINNNDNKKKKNSEDQAEEFSFPPLRQKTLITKLQHFINFSSVHYFHLTLFRSFPPALLLLFLFLVLHNFWEIESSRREYIEGTRKGGKKEKYPLFSTSLWKI